MEMLNAHVNRIDLAYTRRGQGPALVLLHGHPLDRSIWDALAPRLEPCFDLIIPDLRGFGRSSAPDGPYSLADMAGDVAALLDQLGIPHAALAGHSMGGYIALAFCQIFPQRVRSLALVASQVAADPPDRRPARYEAAAMVEQHGMQIIADTFPEKLTARAELQPRLQEIILRQPPRGAAQALRAMAERQDSTGLLPGMEFPVFFVHGTADALIPVQRAREASALVKHGRLIELDAAGHMPMLELPEETAAALRQLE
jgi:pimeloyl-ACP methyl ester carboxylesterase